MRLPRVALDGEPRKAAEQLLDGDPGLEARQRGAEAEVDAVPEGELVGAADAAVEVDPVGVGVGAWVAVGRQHPQRHDRVGGDLGAGEDGRAGGHAADLGERRTQPQDLLDQRRDQARLGTQPGPEPRLPVEGADDAAEQRGGGDVPGEQQAQREVGGLDLGEGAPVDPRGDQRGDQVLPRRVRAGADLVVEVGPDRREDLDHAGAEVGVCRVGDLDVEQGVRPRPEPRVVGGGEAEQLGDHGDREREGQRVDEVEAFAGAVEQLAGDLPDAGLERRDGARGERRAHRPAQRVVLGWVDLREHPRGGGPTDGPVDVRGEGRGVPEGGADVLVAEDVPGTERVAPHRVLVAHPGQPRQHDGVVGQAGGVLTGEHRLDGGHVTLHSRSLFANAVPEGTRWRTLFANEVTGRVRWSRT
ncbi:hypothetical protein BJF90_05240 [Pseudonocardia sp. CNS-004]|nr:hypothetical protein BJF90_05240 [Pseudonocardia sp. CNS-004]